MSKSKSKSKSKFKFNLFIVILLFLIFQVFIGVSCNIEKIREITLPETNVIIYHRETNIFKADSVKALAMLLNRECPNCTFEEKVYVASCVVTGSKSLNISWNEYLFQKNQFWGFSDKRICFDPKIPNHLNNLQASITAWKEPKKVRFYASKIDTPSHYKYVKRKGIKPEGFYHYFRF